MGTPNKNKRARPETPPTPDTVIVDVNGNDIENEVNKVNREKYDEWQRENIKYSRVPFMEKLFDKDGNVYYEPTKENMKFILVPMSSQDIQSRRKQAYNFKGKKMESNNLFKGGNKRRTKRKPKKRKHKKSMKMYK